MSLSGFLFGCALLLIVAGKAVLTYITYNPCEGSGNMRGPVHYEEDDSEYDDSAQEDVKKDLEKLSKKIDKINWRR